jgi:uncharacterized membrane protein
LQIFLSGGLILIIGGIMRAFDAYDGLSGFSTMSAEEKKNWDIIGAGRFLTTVLIVSGIVLIIGGALCLFDMFPNESMFISWSVMVAMTLGSAVYANVSGRFKR